MFAIWIRVMCLSGTQCIGVQLSYVVMEQSIMAVLLGPYKFTSLDRA